MQIMITGRHLDITPALREHAEARLSKLEKYLNKAKDAAVILTVEKHRHIAEISLRVDGYLVQAQEETGEMYASIDKAAEKIAGQLRRYKERLQDHKVRTPASKTVPAERGEEAAPRITKRKRFPITRMTTDDAVMQMDLLDKDFFIFVNVSEGKINLVYRRKNGSIGLIDPVY